MAPRFSRQSDLTAKSSTNTLPGPRPGWGASAWTSSPKRRRCATSLLLRAAEQPDPESPAIGQEGPAKAKTAVSKATLEEVWRAYQDNDALADEKFTGKIVQVTGLVQRVRRMQPHNPAEPAYYLLLCPGGDRQNFAIVCRAADGGPCLVVLKVVGLGERKALVPASAQIALRV